MAKVKRKVKEEYKITLTKKEAVWLRSVLQNPMWVDSPSDEDEMDRKNRINIFNALHEYDSLIR